jgi:hypothetical protein
VSRNVRLSALALGGGALAGAAMLLGGTVLVPDLIVLSTALVVAEQFELRPFRRKPLPLSFAVVVVLLRAATTQQFVIVAVVAYAIAVVLRAEPQPAFRRGLVYAERLLEAFAAAAAYGAVENALQSSGSRVAVLSALAAAAIAEILIFDAIEALSHRRIVPLRARGADLALVTSAMLMAVGYAGIGGVGELGLWGPLLFSIPLLAAWYSFELLASTRRNLQQTVRALGSAPEIAGLVRPGHVERVADLGTAMGADLGLTPAEVEQLEMAALLHHLGAVCLDAPEPGESLDAVAVAESGAAMLRASEALAPAGDIVAAEPLLHRAPGTSVRARGSLTGQVLKVASAYDELTDGRDEHAVWAVEALYTGPLYVYDGRVVGALEHVLEERGVLSPRG